MPKELASVYWAAYEAALEAQAALEARTAAPLRNEDPEDTERLDDADLVGGRSYHDRPAPRLRGSTLFVLLLLMLLALVLVAGAYAAGRMLPVGA